MKSRKFVSFLLVAFTSVFPATFTWAEEFLVHTVRWGDTTLKIALPEDLHGRNPMRDALIRRGIPANDDLIAAFYSEENWFYATIRGFRPNRDVKVTQANFTKQKESIGAGLADGAKVAERALALVKSRFEEARRDGVEFTEFELERPLLFGIHDESDHHFSALMLMAVAEKGGDAEQRVVLVVSQSMLYLNDKVVSISVYRPFEGPDSYGVLKNLTKEIVEQTIDSNH